MPDSQGCGNHGCVLRPLPKGAMGTNAICQCVWRRPYEAESVIKQLRAEIARLKARNTRGQELGIQLTFAASGAYLKAEAREVYKRVIAHLRGEQP